jgi:kynurenine formamidase
MESIDALLAAFAGHRIVDLTRRLEPGIPSYPTHPKYHQMPWPAMGDPAEMNQLVLGEHTGTHVDAPSHFVRDGDPARKHVDELALEGFFGRAVTMRFGPFEPVDALVTRADVEAWERDHGVAARAGDIVLVDFQWGTRWQRVPEGFAFLEHWPGLSRDAAELFRERGVKAVGTDCISLDPGDGGEQLAAHYTLLPAGVAIVENVDNLGRLPDLCFVIALPLPIAGGTGSPVRAIALVADQP